MRVLIDMQKIKDIIWLLSKIISMLIVIGALLIMMISIKDTIKANNSNKGRIQEEKIKLEEMNKDDIVYI